MMPLSHLYDELARIDAKTLDTSRLRVALGNIAFESFWNDPAPSWIKGIHREADGTIQTAMLVVNVAYSAKFGIPLMNYLTRPDDAVWTCAEAFEALDVKVFETGQPQWGYEHARRDDGSDVGGLVHKWPVRDDRGQTVAVSGRAEGWRQHSRAWQAICKWRIGAHLIPASPASVNRVHLALA